ncbi:MAG TPA: TSUP family transporter [Gaiellales bacterium]|jgi:hypothetical protein|nr:TSUP family transporter [Gaiellales bacterium]
MHILGAFLAGLLVATVTTPAGVSGAVLLLPVQVSLLGVPSPSVTPTNLIFNLFATPSGVLRYRRLRGGGLMSPLAARLLAGTVPGVVVGAVVRVEWLSGQQAFYLAAGAVLAMLGTLLVVRRPAPAERPLNLAVIPPVAAAVGVVGGIYGIGGGSFLAPILILGGYTAYNVAPAALLSTLAASVVGVVSFVVLGATSSGPTHIAPDWGVGIAAGAGGLIGAYVGAGLQSRIPESRLRRRLGWLSLLIAARYLYLGAAG